MSIFVECSIEFVNFYKFMLKKRTTLGKCIWFPKMTCVFSKAPARNRGTQHFLTLFWCSYPLAREGCKKKARGTEEHVKAFKVLKEHKTCSCSWAHGAHKTRKGKQAEPTLCFNTRFSDNPFPSLALNWGSGDSMVDHRCLGKST